MALLSAAMVAAALALVLLGVPRWLLPSPRDVRSGVDELFVDLIRGTVLVVSVTVVLVQLGLFQWPGLLLAAAAVRAYTRRRGRRRSPAATTPDRLAERARGALYLLEAASEDGNEEVKTGVRRWCETAVANARPHLRWASARRHLPLAVVLASSLALRLAYAVEHAALVPANSYTELAAIARMAMGELFTSGAPVGLRAVLATAAEVTTASNADVVRFAGPLLATAVVAAVYVLVVKASGREMAGLAAAAIVGLPGLGRGVGLTPLHQVGTVPGALGLLLALAGALMLLEHVRSPQWARLRYAGLSALGVMLVDPAGLALLAAAGVATAVVLGTRDRSPTPALQVAVVLGGGAAAGSIPLLLSDASPAGHLAATATARPSLVMIGLGAAIVLAGLLQGGGVVRGDRLPFAVLVGTALACPLVAELISVSFPGVVTEPGVANMLLPVGIAGALVLVPSMRRARQPKLLHGRAARWASPVPVAAGLAAAGAMAVMFPPQVPHATGAQTEYDAAARVLGTALRRTADLTYTVVGPREWTSWVVGRAYRADLAEFADRLVPEQAADPGFELPVPSRRVLVLTEKRAFHGPSGTADSVTARQEVMERVDGWVRLYQRYHAGTAILYEDDSIRVWHLKESGNRALAERLGFAAR